MQPDSHTFPVCTCVLQRANLPTPDKPASFARQIGSIVAGQQAVTSNTPLHDRCSSNSATGQVVAESVGCQLPHLCVAYQEVTAFVRGQERQRRLALPFTEPERKG